MNRYIKQHGTYSNLHQQHARAEISRQIEEYLGKGGKIEKLSGPQFLPHRAVRITNTSVSEAL
ncbi:Uncharacterised protein [Zhongshania aliphaticivorans]|uniref:Uncharacterized protein n=1 Tax=Zhongshania aliphaticivorans TaxID=1470434 RepID=A0A5S9N8R7_9GAMM|nr:hypothetical protein [Zhongshania aliphaticivorans]CAA0078841.1 Uncharacterised protein [Zhongshania aliphaticivorans]CAA0086404.1 Uncharacterised protein [Zhongshania aliphaticivorans]